MQHERQGDGSRVSRAVAAFKTAWQAAVRGSSPPRLEVFMQAVPEAEPAAYLRELMAVELECRAKLREAVNAADYVQRFPDHAATIQAAFAERGLVSGRERSMQQAITGTSVAQTQVAQTPADCSVTQSPVVQLPQRSAIPQSPLTDYGVTQSQVVEPSLTESNVKPGEGAWSVRSHSVNPSSGEFSFTMEGIEGLEEPGSPSKVPTADEQPLAPGTELGNYTILELISQGAMGAVYKAEHRRMGRTVAIKMITPSALRDAVAVQRFQRETQAIARLEHPNIVTAHDADQVGEIHILVMQYVDGEDLWTTVQRCGPLPLDLAVQCLTQTARGMEYAHQCGVVHRDIKPANLVLARNGVLKVLDLGLARLEKSLIEDPSFTPNLTDPASIMGTADYMAPEQAVDATAADQRADVYSLGCTFYFLLTGKSLFAGDSVTKRIMAHRLQPIPSLSIVRPDVPEWLEAIFRKMVAKEAPDRYQSMTAVLSDLAPYTASDLSSREAPCVDQAPMDVAGEQTMHNAGLKTQFQPAAAERPGPVVQTISASRRSAAETAARKRRRLLGAAAVLGFLVLGLLATLVSVIHVATDEGALIIEAASDDIKSALDGKRIRITDASTGRLLSLQPGGQSLKVGEYTIDAADLPPGVEVSPLEFQVKRGNRTTLKVTLVKPEEQ
jgi:serine/threonine-protein kinase